MRSIPIRLQSRLLIVDFCRISICCSQNKELAWSLAPILNLNLTRNPERPYVEFPRLYDLIIRHTGSRLVRLSIRQDIDNAEAIIKHLEQHCERLTSLDLPVEFFLLDATHNPTIAKIISRVSIMTIGPIRDIFVNPNAYLRPVFDSGRVIACLFEIVASHMTEPPKIASLKLSVAPKWDTEIAMFKCLIHSFSSSLVEIHCPLDGKVALLSDMFSNSVALESIGGLQSPHHIFGNQTIAIGVECFRMLSRTKIGYNISFRCGRFEMSLLWFLASRHNWSIQAVLNELTTVGVTTPIDSRSFAHFLQRFCDEQRSKHLLENLNFLHSDSRHTLLPSPMDIKQHLKPAFVEYLSANSLEAELVIATALFGA